MDHPVYFIYEIFLSIPISSSFIERLLSFLCRLKTLRRNTIDQERLNNIVI